MTIQIKDIIKHYEGIEIIKILGKGVHGSVYLVKYNNKKYAMKIEQIFENDLKKNYKSHVWREIEFSDTLSKKYPNCFMKIYKYKNKKCDYVHKLDKDKWKFMKKSRKDFYKKLFASSYCSIKLMSLSDDTLDNVIYKLTDKKKILYLLIQVVNIAYLINKEKYFHRDLKPSNIGIIFTKNEYIKIFDQDIPTLGYKLQALDYGSVLHKKYELEKREKLELKYNNDLQRIFYEIIFKIMMRNLINKYPKINIDKRVVISNDDKKKLRQYLGKNKLDNFNWVGYNYFTNMLYKIFFFDKFQEQLGIKNKVKLFKFISKNAIIYYVKKFYNIKKVLKYLISQSI